MPKDNRIFIRGKFLFFMWGTYGMPPEKVKEILDEQFFGMYKLPKRK